MKRLSLLPLLLVLSLGLSGCGRACTLQGNICGLTMLVTDASGESLPDGVYQLTVMGQSEGGSVTCAIADGMEAQPCKSPMDNSQSGAWTTSPTVRMGFFFKIAVGDTDIISYTLLRNGTAVAAGELAVANRFKEAWGPGCGVCQDSVAYLVL